MAYERKAEPIGRELVRRLLPRRDPEGHKGTFGKVLCLCGSVGYTGAPVFASRGAVRSGAGLVFLGVPESIWPVAAVKSDEAMPFPLPEAEGRLSLLAEETIRRRAAGCDAVLLGCGLGRGRQTDALVRRLMDLPQPLVLDADGINALAGHMDEWERRRGRVTVLTPHEGEFLRVAGGLCHQAHQPKHKRHALPDLRRAGADDAHGESHVIINRHLGDQAKILKNHAHGAAQQRNLLLFHCGQIKLPHADCAAGRRFLMHDELEEGALASAGSADDKHKFAFLNFFKNILLLIRIRKRIPDVT